MVARAADTRLHLWTTTPPGPKRRFGFMLRVRLNGKQAAFVEDYSGEHRISEPEVIRRALDKFMEEQSGVCSA